MAARSLVLTGPVPLPGGPSVAHLAALVSADILVRHARVAGADVAWVVAAVAAGGLAAQRWATDDLLREGLDRATVGRDAFVGRMAALAESGRRDLAAVASGLGLGFDAAAAAGGAAAAAAARTAFVRLFDAGLIHEEERVLGVCPGCATTVGAPEAVPVDLDCEALTLRLALLDDADAAGHLDVVCLAPELLPGVVAVAVPDGSPAAGRSVAAPVAASVVPVVADAGVVTPTLVVPAHDPWALDVAKRLGLATVAVVDAAGAVCSPGPLAGLARYAARAAARRLLEAERVVVATAPGTERAERCPGCRAVLVPLLGTHWLLTVPDLETAAADAVRDGRLVVWPAVVRDDLLVASGQAGEWCLSQQVWGGVAIPVGRCLDCGHVDVSVHPATSCGKCMGDLVPADDVLDTRFMRCVWPLAAAGWPGAGRGAGERGGGPALLVVAAEGAGDIAPMVALGLRLDGAVPFDEVVVLDPPGVPPGAGTAPGADPAALVAREGAAVVRVALACGGLDVGAARELVARIDQPPIGSGDVERLAAAMAGALAAASPAAALGMLAAAVGEGVPAADAPRVRELAAPFVGR